MSITTLREALKSGKLQYGTRETLRNLKRGRVKVVFLSADCNEKTKHTILYYASLSKVDVVPLKQHSKELAQICKKNFPVSLASY